jgi:hypothetical protein
MGNPVPRATEVDPEASAGGPEILMIVGILVIRLEQIVIHILGRQFRFHPVDPEGLKLEHGHRAGGVLQQCVIDSDPDLLVRDQSSCQEVCL